LVTFSFQDLSIEAVLDSLSKRTGYFFSYNSEILPKGSKYTLEANNEPLDKFLTTLLVGTGLKFSTYKDQIILNYEPVLEPSKKKYFTISGVITNEANEPVEQVNMFLDGTTIGSFTDSNGIYNITGIPPGIYDLVISHVSHNQESYKISEYEGGDRIFNTILSTKTKVLDEVEIVAKQIETNSTDWIEYYQLFKTELLGKTANAKACVIENPEVLHFLYDEDSETLRANAKSPIVIRNDALGYRINYFLESFIKSSENLKYRGKLRFKNIQPSNKAELKLWKSSRKKSYLGSFKHFKRALLDKRLKKEGFRIYSLEKLDDLNKDELEGLAEDDLLVYKGDHYELSFKEFLLVEYRKEKESIDFLAQSEFIETLYKHNIDSHGNLIKSPDNQISVIRLLKNKVRVGLEGQLMDKFALTSYGYWAWERAGDLVPINYDPKYDKFLAPQ